MREKPKVDQILYSLNVGNACRNGVSKLTRVKVSKVGIKYFYCERVAYHIKTWKEKTDWQVTSKLFGSEQAWSDEKEMLEICKEIGKVFEYGHNHEWLSLAKLRSIREIINGDER